VVSNEIGAMQANAKIWWCVSDHVDQKQVAQNEP
jgi:hypothetical protein